MTNVVRKVKSIIAAFFVFLAAPSFAQKTPIIQAGTITPGHAVQWTATGIVQDAGTATRGTLTGLGITASGPSSCINSNLVTASGWQQLCFGVTTAGGATISVQNFGTATPQPFTVTVNGTAYQFPFTTTGVVGPNSSTIGDIALWNNNSGTLLSDFSGVTNNLLYWSGAHTLANTTALPNGITATTQSSSDNTTLVATDAMVQGAISLNSTHFAGSGISTGSANAQVVAATSPSGFSLSGNPTVNFIAGFSNTGGTTLNVVSTGAKSVLKKTTAGLVALVTGDIIANQQYLATYDGTNYELQEPSSIPFVNANIGLTNSASWETMINASPSITWTWAFNNAAAIGSNSSIRLTSNGVAGNNIYFGNATGVGQTLWLWAGSPTLTVLPTTGLYPGFALNGDMLVNDIWAGSSNPMTYFKRTTTGLDISARTNFNSSQNGTSGDTDGGSVISLGPVLNAGGAVNDGNIQISAYGIGTGASANAVRFATRSSAGVVTDRVIVQGNGHVYEPGQSTATSVGTCGSGAAINGSDDIGNVQMGSGSTVCTVTFGAVFATTPICLVVDQTGVRSGMSYTVSTSAIVVAGATASDVLNYICRATS